MSSTAADPTNVAGPNRKPKPKRPMTAYNFFFKEEHNRMKKDYEDSKNKDNDDDANSSKAEGREPLPPKKRRKKISYQEKVSFEDLGKLIGKRWRALGDEEMQKYKDLAKKDSDRYKKESAEYYQDQINAVCLGYNLPGNATADFSETNASPMSLTQEANLAMEAVNKTRHLADKKKRGRKSKTDKTEQSAAQQPSQLGMLYPSGTGTSMPAVAFNPVMMMNPAFFQQYQAQMAAVTAAAPAGGAAVAPTKEGGTAPSTSGAGPAQQAVPTAQPQTMTMNPAQQMQFMQQLMSINPQAAAAFGSGMMPAPVGMNGAAAPTSATAAPAPTGTSTANGTASGEGAATSAGIEGNKKEYNVV